MSKGKIGDVLVRMGYVVQREVEAAVSQQRARGGAPRLGEILVELLCCDEEHIAKAVAYQAGMKDCRISKFRIPPEVLAKVPKDVAEEELIVPLKVGSRALIVATESPLDFFALDNLRFQLGMEVEAVIASALEIQGAIDSYYGGRAKTPHSLDDLKVASGRGLFVRALSRISGEVEVELRADYVRLSGVCGGLGVQHELRLGPVLQGRLLDTLQLEASVLAAALREWQVVSVCGEDQPVDVLVRAFPAQGGRSLTIRPA